MKYMIIRGLKVI